jgi:hypothetical protein
MRLFLVIFLLPFFCLSQRQNNFSRSEIGFLGGGSYYIGDLNTLKHFNYSKVASGVFYRFNLNSRIAYKVGINYTNVSASDAWSSEELYQNRNLSFSSSIIEVSGGVEFNYFPFQIGNPNYRGSGYLFLDLAYFQMNPKTVINSETVELRTIGTEGQNTPLNSKGYYSKNQLAIPFGIGFKFPVGNFFCIGLEYSVRKLFTDYLDDVGSDRFIDISKLKAYEGPLALALSNRNLDGSPYGVRGNSKTNDWYFIYGLKVSFRLGNPDKCFKH